MANPSDLLSTVPAELKPPAPVLLQFETSLIYLFLCPPVINLTKVKPAAGPTPPPSSFARAYGVNSVRILLYFNLYYRMHITQVLQTQLLGQHKKNVFLFGL